MTKRRAGFQVFGIPIRVHSTWFIVLAFVTWTLSRRYFPDLYPGLSPSAYFIMGLTAALMLFVCVLLHELGHSLTARAFGIRVTRVTLFIFGGVAQIAESPQRPWVEFLVALAGPLVSLAIAGLCFALLPLLAQQPSAGLLATALVHYLGMINIVLVLFNLLPGFPLDGGRILRALLWAWTGSFYSATRIASSVGSLIALGLFGSGAWALVKGEWLGGLWYIVLGFFLRDAAHRAFQHAKHYEIC